MKKTLLLITIILLVLSSCQKINLNEIDHSANEWDDKINKILSSNNMFEVHRIDESEISKYKSKLTKSLTQDTLAQALMLNEYVEYVDNQWQLNISLEEAAKLGVSGDIYNTIYKSMVDVNKFIVSSILTYEYRKANCPGSVPRVKSTTESGGGGWFPGGAGGEIGGGIPGGGIPGSGSGGGGGGGGGTYPPPPTYTTDANGIYIPNPPINVYRTASLDYMPQTTSFAGPYKIKASVFVQTGIGAYWAYTIHDEVYQKDIFATGNNLGPKTYEHQFAYLLVPQHGKCSWRMVGSRAGADNTSITVTYTSNLK